jgi:predicted enzyme related to lactoylglutathione lyase
MDQRAGVYRPGAIVWREHATTDLERSTAFYGELFGWKHKDSSMGEMGVYRHFQAGGVEIAGCYKLGPQMAGVPSHWMHYVSVADVDAATATAKTLGASVKMGPFDIPNVGRATYLADPQGANFALFRDLKGDGPAMAPPYPPGVFCWETLNTTDKAGAGKFYAAVAGITVGEFQGGMMFATGDKPTDGVADVEDAPPGVPSHWLSHVVVDKLADSRARAEKLGARILMGEIAIPNVGTMAVIQDPVGAFISLYQPESRS